MPQDPAQATGSRWLAWSLPVLVVVTLWIIVGALGSVVLLRLVAWDALSVLAILNAMTIVIYLPVWPIAIVGALGRRFFLAGTALVIGAIQVALLLPEFTATQPVPTWAAKASTFVLLDANVYNENHSMAGYADRIREVRPDVVTFEECTTSDVAQMRASGSFDRLPYTVEVPGVDPFVFLIASRYRLVRSKINYLYNRPLMVQTEMMLPSGPQPLWVVHTIAPLPVSFDQWRGQLGEINHLVRGHGSNRLLLAGDFNATWNNRGFRQIVSDGLTDAAAARGVPLQMTWSQMMAPIPPLVRIDHVLTGPGVAVTHITTESGPGSDHRAIVATVAVHPGATSS